SNYEVRSAAEALSVHPIVSVPLTRGRPGGPTPLAQPESASVGPLAMADVNGDGLLDLFVGARVIPGAWPLPAPSRLYLRKPDGTWERDAANARAVSALGLVSAAMFSDLDGDGRPDLIAASEWGPVRILHNVGGTLTDVTARWGLSDQRSRWIGLAAGDFDGDGRMDLAATSWGLNTPWVATPANPYALVVGNFGGSGPGLVFARRDSATGREKPLAPFARLGLAIPSLRDRINTFADFSRATVDEVLGPDARGAVRVGATTFAQLVLLNRGDHFETRVLPAAAQLSPASPVVADFDGDGHEDLFLAQNFFPTEIDLPRFDAGAGLVLLGDGRGGFRPLDVRQSGISIPGDQRGAAVADMDGDGRVDLAVSQNGAPTTLWRNRGGAPGVRVRVNAGAGNPLGVGAQIRLVTRGMRGPIREIHAGSGYWSMDAAASVLGARTAPDSLWVRWPGGAQTLHAIPPGRRDLLIVKP
ncbi:MAG: CRTAC1 family protein, partial [Gemmatimonadaceae bacterium]